MVSLGALALVAACASSGGGATSTSSTTSQTASLAGVTVSGDVGKAPTLTLSKTPFSVAKTTTKVLSAGTGAAIKQGQKVQVDYLLVDGRDGKERDTTFGKQPRVFTADPTKLLPGLATGMINEKVGSRVLVAIPPADGFGTQGNTQLDVQKDDTMLFVLDLKTATTPLTKPDGTVVPPKPGLPTVKEDAKGTPVVTLPSGAAPTKLVTQPLIKGKGAVIKAGQSLTVNYVGVIWPGGKIFDSSFASGKTAEFVIGEGQVIKGWDQGLVGQTVGSRLLLVIPPDLGYGAQGNPSGGIKGSDTLVFVVDVLDAS
jgi:FKBP-type peptidyl-prolyl cis-trans isomerase